jgi:hypothetical protein
MLVAVLLLAHVLVIGYWLGAELVINSTYRYVAFSAAMPFAERDRLMDHVMDVDQHVRYALVLQAGIGSLLLALLGYLPGGAMTAWIAAGTAMAWLLLVEATHRLRKAPAGARLAAIDRALRYLAIAALGGAAGACLSGLATLPRWLAWKFALLALVVACGLGIRFALMAFFSAWGELARGGSTPASEQRVRASCLRATGVLVLLWLCIGGVVVLSLLKPG